MDPSGSVKSSHSYQPHTDQTSLSGSSNSADYLTMDKHESETNTQQRPAAAMPPPSGPPQGVPVGAQRADSISMYTNFNAPRLSTDASLSSFLNIAEGQQQQQQQLQQQQQVHQQQQPQQQQAGGQLQPQPQGVRQDLGPYSRGYSIINNFWPAAGAPAGAGVGGSGIAVGPMGPEAGQFTVMRRQSEQLEPFMPRFKTPSFSSGRSGPSQLQQPVPPPSGRPDMMPGSKRNSIFFGTNDPPDLDIFNPNSKRDSTVMMKPPHILPQRGSSTNSTSSAPQATNVAGSNPTPASGQESDLDALFSQGLSSRKNSMKFSGDDFDFQFKRRDSSVRATLDNQGYMPHPIAANSGKQAPDQLKKSSGSESPMHKPDDDVEARIHKHLTPMLQQDNIEPDSKDLKGPRPDTKKRKIASPKDGESNADSMKDLVGLLDSKDSILVGDDGRPLVGATKVDQLMLVIQARKKGVTDKVPRAADGSLLLESAPVIIPPASELVGGVEKPKARGVKQHECPYCHKCFTQSTHLEVHVRSHIGYKPFQCEYCGKRFTQGGNLRTHVRLHTGEKPYECEKCGRRFSRKGNLAAHKLTHENLKPFHCKLDGCNKSFTQLGNMKAHQNRFHLQTLNELTQRLAEMDPNENIPPEEKELLEYFADLYKNSNRGIKGRGKGNTRVAPAASPVIKSSHSTPNNAVLISKPQNQEATLVAAKALGSNKPLDGASHPELTYNLCTPSSENGNTAVDDNGSDPSNGHTVPQQNEFTFSLDQNHSHGASDMHFKDVSYHS